MYFYNFQAIFWSYEYYSFFMLVLFVYSVPSGAWSAMAELTPTSLDVILDRMGGLRRMADLVNRNVTAW